MKVTRDEVIVYSMCSLVVIVFAYFGGLTGWLLYLSIFLAISFPYIMKLLRLWK